MLNQSLSKKRKGFELLMRTLMISSAILTAVLVVFLLVYVSSDISECEYFRNRCCSDAASLGKT